MSDEGITRSAILLMSLGENEAAEVLKHLAPREVQKLGASMAILKTISREAVEKVLTDFHSEASQQATLGASDDYLRSVLTKALGDDTASTILSRILSGDDTSGIESLKWMEASAVAELIKNEHPQIITSILVHLDRDQASEILSFFTDRLRADVFLRIATLDGIQPAALQELNDVLTKLLSGNKNIKKKNMGGVKAASEILNFLPTVQEEIVIQTIREQDNDLADQLLDQMFVFENLLDLDDKSIQLLLREIQSESLIVALKGASEELRQKVFANMSARAAEMMKDDLESKGPVKLSEVETEQKEILKTVRRLADEGQIILGGKGEEQYV